MVKLEWGRAMQEPIEVIGGERLVQMLLSWISSRQVCEMKIPHTAYGWITLLLGLQPMGRSLALLVDRMKGIERFMMPYDDLELRFELKEQDGVPYWFETRLIEYGPELVWAEVPEAIHRMQRRRFFRIKARSGTEIILPFLPGSEKRTRVNDYGMGGVAFLIDPSTCLRVGDQINGIDLRVPETEGQVSFRVIRSVVRRIERGFPKLGICAIEFLEMPETTRDQLGRHVFREERRFLGRLKKS